MKSRSSQNIYFELDPSYVFFSHDVMPNRLSQLKRDDRWWRQFSVTRLLVAILGLKRFHLSYRAHSPLRVQWLIRLYAMFIINSNQSQSQSLETFEYSKKNTI